MLNIPFTRLMQVFRRTLGDAKHEPTACEETGSQQELAERRAARATRLRAKRADLEEDDPNIYPLY